MSGARWPGENGVPLEDVAGCPNFPECMCAERCAEEEVHGPGLLRVERVLIVSIIALALVALWIGYTWGAAHG
mgnify:CR=1 FL=1